VVGGGFGGLEAVKALRRLPVDVTLIDRTNYHLFQPLNYQVATAALSPDEIAEPLRTIFRRDRNVRVLLGEVTELDLERRAVVMRPGVDELGPQTIHYETLVVATGSSYSYFGHDEWRSHALEVKTLDGAMDVRGRILRAFEAAELEAEAPSREAWLTFVVVGGGPTGVEMAGQIGELARDALPEDFRATDPRSGRILLVETTDRVLPSFPPALSRRGADALRELGVTPMTRHTVVGVDPGAVDIRRPDGTVDRIRTRTVVWAAGVTASSLAGALAGASGADTDVNGRVTVEPDLTLPAHPDVLAIGDMVRVRDRATGKANAFPGVAPVAMQQGRYAGRLVGDRLAQRETPPWRYRDKGNLATIGRARAVADLPGRLRLAGLVAWVIWLAVHLWYLVGFENRVVVFVRWAYSFVTRNRGARLIT
jgi:NADH:ubiquinone reductase (H+-translocating)